MAQRGQRSHRSRSLRWRRDESCTGAVGRAYRRIQAAGRQRWVVIGEYCDGCQTFWPLAAIEGRKRIYGPKRSVVAEVGRDSADEIEVPEFVRFMRGEL